MRTIRVTHVVEVEDGRALNSFVHHTPQVFSEGDGWRLVSRLTQPNEPFTEGTVQNWITLIEGAGLMGHYPIDDIDTAALEGTGMAYMIPLIERRRAYLIERQEEAEAAEATAIMNRFMAQQEES